MRIAGAPKSSRSGTRVSPKGHGLFVSVLDSLKARDRAQARGIGKVQGDTAKYCKQKICCSLIHTDIALCFPVGMDQVTVIGDTARHRGSSLREEMCTVAKNRWTT